MNKNDSSGKPWDVIRREQSKLPIGVGKFSLPSGLEIEVVEKTPYYCAMSFGGSQERVGINKDSARLLKEFFAELEKELW